MRFNTPLRYPGGKGKLTEFIKRIFVSNNLVSGHYIEPYAGGAGIALNLLMADVVSTIHLNDLNPTVYAFWDSVLNHADDLCSLINTTDITMDEWHKQKMILSKPDSNSALEIGFATFFLNRTNHSGILLGGVIGGKNQNGAWKLDARFNKLDLINRIQRIAMRKNDIHLYNLDSADLIKTILPTLPSKTLVYLDPPYYVKGKGLYQNHYQHDDHLLIADLIKNHISHPWVVSYDFAPEIISMYEGCPMISYGINYSAQNKYIGAEAMFFSDQLLIPETENPSKLDVS